MDGEIQGGQGGVMGDGVGRLRLLLLPRLGGVGATGEAVQMRPRHFHAVVVKVEILLGGIEISTGRKGEFLLRDVIRRHTEGAGIGEDGEAEDRLHARARAQEHLRGGRDTTKNNFLGSFLL